MHFLLNYMHLLPRGVLFLISHVLKHCWLNGITGSRLDKEVILYSSLLNALYSTSLTA